MPLNKQIKKVLVIGSGPIIIGQGAEFDYSGTQACKAIREEGITVVLVNSNPATIMTDPEVADKIYLEPLTLPYIEKIIISERPDSLLAGMGGQTALNLAVQLEKSGILGKYNVQLIGTDVSGIEAGEDRELFKVMMNQIGEPVIKSDIVTEMDQGLAFAETIGYPVIVRPAYTLGGSGGGIAEDAAALRLILSSGLSASPVGQVLLEKSVKGWKEIEYEVMRDGSGNCISVCNMENLDPVGIHTGDSIVTAPSQTLSDKEYQMLRTSAFKIIEAVGIKGGCNVQFALNPDSFDYAVIEINPRVSRSSALASKATGYPIAKIAAKIALGYDLPEIINPVTGSTSACFEPSLDYVVVKIPKWPFDKFPGAGRTLGTKMMATGEIMAIGSNFEAALLKGIRSLETGNFTLLNKKYQAMTSDTLKAKAIKADDERLFALAELIRRNYRLDKVAEITGIDRWFLFKLQGIIEEERKLAAMSLRDFTPDYLRALKKKGFSDLGIAMLIHAKPSEITTIRELWGIHPAYKMVDTCAGEFEAVSPYYYSTYEEYDEVAVSSRKKIAVIGSGPIRIGQGIEFDYASVHCVKALARMGYETIMINNNPETVSTDFNIADKLYFEPLTEEDVLNILKKEQPVGVMLQFGGQTAIKLSRFLSKQGIRIFGASHEQIDQAENREKFDALLQDLAILRPKGASIIDIESGKQAAASLGYPLLVRPSYVIGGQGMEICYTDEDLGYYLEKAFEKDSRNPVLIDQYLVGQELEIDAVSDGTSVLIPGVMEHLERAGIHSGDSMTLYPSQSVSEVIKAKVLEYARRIAGGMCIKGIFNIQFIVSEEKLYVIEVNPRSSRTVPYVSKVSGIPIVDIATSVSLGYSLKELGYDYGYAHEAYNLISVKVPVFSTKKLPDVEISLGPEMRSTGEVLGIGRTLEEALYKGFLAADYAPSDPYASILLTVGDPDKVELKAMSNLLKQTHYRFYATTGTKAALESLGVSSQEINRIHDASPNILDLIVAGELDLIVNTPTKGGDAKRDGFIMRRAAAERSIPVYTSLDTFRAFLTAMAVIKGPEDTDVYDMGINRSL